jgi:IS30 family transposase
MKPRTARVHALRAAGMKRTAIARELGVSASTIDKELYGNRTPYVPVAQRRAPNIQQEKSKS